MEADYLHILFTDPQKKVLGSIDVNMNDDPDKMAYRLKKASDRLTRIYHRYRKAAALRNEQMIECCEKEAQEEFLKGFGHKGPCELFKEHAAYSKTVSQEFYLTRLIQGASLAVDRAFDEKVHSATVIIHV